MPNINFDQVGRRDAKEPQITKTQLLEPPQHVTSGTGWDTPRSTYGVGDLVANDASWSFDALDTTETPSSDSKAPVKQEPTTPAPGFAQHNGQYDSHNDNIDFKASKKSRDPNGATGRQASVTSSDDKYGHKTGVIDLTTEDSDDEQDLAMPERQFVPRAELDSTASPFPRQKTSSPPRTFTKGLEPIAAHPRKPPIMHRQKPPIKPASRHRKPVNASSPSPASAVPTISGQRPRLLSAQPNILSFSETPDRSSTTPGRETDSMDPIREKTPVPTVVKNPSGPFVEDDDSSEDEDEAAAKTKKIYARNVTRFLKRPRDNTPTRARNDELVEQSRVMRAKAHERAQADFATRANTVASIEFPSDTDGALSPPVRSTYNKSGSDALKRKLSVLESRATHAGSAKRQQTLMDFHQAKKSGSHQHHKNSRNSLESLLQKERAANRIHSGVRPAGEIAFTGHQSKLQRQIDARKKASAQERRKAAFRNEQVAAQRLAAGQTLEDYRAEQDAWIDRASVAWRASTSRPTGHATFPNASADRQEFAVARRRLEAHRAEQSAFIDRAAAARNSTSRPSGHASLSGAAPTCPRPAAPTKPVPGPKATKQGLSILGQLGSDAKKAKERQARELQARKEQMRETPDDITDSQAQREAEENHAISKQPPYQPPRRINTVPGSNHAMTQPRPYKPLQTTYTIPEPHDDAKSQTDPEEDLVLEPSPPPQGPFSLNSAAGIRAIQKLQPRLQPINLPFDDNTPPQTAAQRFMGTSIAKTKLSLKKPSRNQDLLPITASDLKLYHWREQKINWAEVRQLYSDFTGITPLKSEDALRTRFRQVSKVVEIGVVTAEMCERVINGDEQAAAELNRLAAQYADLSGSLANPAGLEPAPFRKIVQQKTPAPRGMTVPPPPAATAAAAAPATVRPTQGGKSIGHDEYVMYLLNHADANATESDTDSDDTDSRAGSPLAPEDRIHNEYFVEYRHMHSEDIENDFEDLDAETPWVQHNATFAHVGTANAEAVQLVMTVPEGAPAILKPAEGWELTQTPLEDCMSSFNMKTAYGLVQTRTGRRLRTWQDNVMPETKAGWLPKTLYGVFVKKTQLRTRIVRRKKKAASAAVVVATDDDSLFGDGGEEKAENEEQEEEEVEESEEPCVDPEFYQLNDDVYGSLGHANQEAIKEWVRLTMKPSTANLAEFACRCADARQELQRRLESEVEGTVFRMVMEDDEKTVEVFAKALNMKGARN